MSSIKEFEKITSAEGFFEFFDIEYDEDILKTKRYFILKLFSDLTANASMFTEEKKLEFYRFSLLKIYGDFVNGLNPTAADVWGAAVSHTCGSHGEGGGGGCSSGSCSTSSTCKPNGDGEA